jgi:hypothetical protein
MKETEDGGVEPGGEQPPAAAGERSKRWPRRRLLRWALGLVPAAAGGGWAAFEWLGGRERLARRNTDDDPWADPQLREAAWLCFANHQGAYWTLDRLLQSPTSRNAPARLLRACLAMERGWPDMVRHDLAWPEVRDTLEARLLLELSERRPRSPDGRHAFFEAWDALGRPDFSKSSLLPEPLEDSHTLPILHEDQQQLAEPQRLPVVTVAPEQEESTLQEWGLAQVRASTSVPLLMALRERLLLLKTQTPARQQLLPAVEERLGQLTGPVPQTLQLALRSFLAGSPPETPLGRRDLEALEQLVPLEWKQPSSEHFFREMRERFEGVLLLPGHHAWLLTSWAQGVSLGRELLRRARSSAEHLSEDERRWMGRLLWEVGTRLREQHSRVELETGLRLQMYGSELTQHMPTRMDSIGLWVELGQWEEALKRAAWNRWPLASLREEACEPRVRDEHAWLKAFAGKGELP